MTITDELVSFIGTAKPSEAALMTAANQLDVIRRRLRDSGQTTRDAHPAGTPTAMNLAWRTAISAGGSESWLSVCATVIALQHRAAGPETIAVNAVAVGNVVADHMHAPLRSTPTANRWSHHSVAGIVGAGAAAGRFLELEDAQLRNLLGLCATQAAGLAGSEATEAGTLQLAKAAADAIEAATLARHGFTSSADGFSGRRGLFEVLAPGAAWPAGLGAGQGTAGA